MFLRISYSHESNSPRYPGNPANRVRPVFRLAEGDNCNAAEVCLFNHNGSHMDLPNHYHAGGRQVADYDISEFIFSRPLLIRVGVGECQAITSTMLRRYEEMMVGKDLVLLRTGFGTLRAFPVYTNNPYLTLDAAQFLRGLSGLRAIGIDFLSLTNPRFQELGDEVHRVLLDDLLDGKPILIIEDLELSSEAIIDRFHRVFAIPLFVDGVDGMPCTVFGEYEV